MVLRVKSWSAVSRLCLTSCWVMVEPPCSIWPDSTLESRARTVARASMPLWRKKSASSTDEHGVDHVLRDVVDGDRRPVLLVLQRGDQRAVAGVDVRPLIEVSEVDRRRYAVGGAGQLAQGRADDQPGRRQQQRTQCEHEREAEKGWQGTGHDRCSVPAVVVWS